MDGIRRNGAAVKATFGSLRSALTATPFHRWIPTIDARLQTDTLCFGRAKLKTGNCYLHKIPDTSTGADKAELNGFRNLNVLEFQAW